MNTAWLSKINWTQGIAMVAMVFTVFGVDVPDSTKVDAVAAITAGQGVLTWVFRTWFTK